MNYREIRSYIGDKRFAVKLGLEHITELLKRLGNPDNAVKIVHVAGTNGKGSTSAAIASVLQSAGYRTGLFCSPYVFDYLERVRVDGCNVSEDDFARLGTVVAEQAEEMEREGKRHPTAFEMELAAALLYYAERKCDYAVLEVGLGGRLDATNAVCKTLLSVVTRVDLDHTAELGNTLSQIAYEKAGIIREGGTVVCAENPSEVTEVVSRVAVERHAAYYPVGRAEFLGFSDGRLQVRYKGGTYAVGLRGTYQVQNVATAIEAVYRLRELGTEIPDEALKSGLKQAVWTGRFDLAKSSPDVILDGAHNPNGARALADTLVTYYPKTDFIFVFGMYKDKDWKSVAEILLPLGKRFYVLTPPSERGLSADILADYLSSKGADARVFELPKALELAQSDARRLLSENRRAVVTVCGSLSFLGEAKRLLDNMK